MKGSNSIAEKWKESEELNYVHGGDTLQESQDYSMPADSQEETSLAQLQQNNY